MAVPTMTTGGTPNILLWTSSPEKLRFNRWGALEIPSSIRMAALASGIQHWGNRSPNSWAMCTQSHPLKGRDRVERKQGGSESMGVLLSQWCFSWSWYAVVLSRMLTFAFFSLRSCLASEHGETSHKVCTVSVQHPMLSSCTTMQWSLLRNRRGQTSNSGNKWTKRRTRL